MSNYLEIVDSTNIEEVPSLAPWDGRLPTQYVDFLVVTSDSDYAERKLCEVIDGKVQGESYTFPEGASNIHLAKDLNGNFISAFTDTDQVIQYAYFNDLTQKREVVKVPEATSIFVTLSTPYQNIETPEGLVLYTRMNGPNTEVVVRNQLTRYSAESEQVVFTVSGSKQLRTGGLAENNRFLYRFFDKIKLV